MKNTSLSRFVKNRGEKTYFNEKPTNILWIPKSNLAEDLKDHEKYNHVEDLVRFFNKLKMVYQKIDLLVTQKKAKIYARMKKEILGKIEKMEGMKFENALMCGSDLAGVKRQMENYT